MASVGAMYISDTDADSNNMQAFLDEFSNGGAFGLIRVASKASSGTKFWDGVVNTLLDIGAYHMLTVTFIASAGGDPSFSNGEAVIVTFSPSGAASTVPGPTGPTGAASTITGPTGPTGPTGAASDIGWISPQWWMSNITTAYKIMYFPSEAVSGNPNTRFTTPFALSIQGAIISVDVYSDTDDYTVECNINESGGGEVLFDDSAGDFNDNSVWGDKVGRKAFDSPISVSANQRIGARVKTSAGSTEEVAVWFYGIYT